MERLQSIGLFTHTHELDRLAGNVTHRQRGTATGVTIGFGQYHTGQRQRFVKGLGGVGSILTCHGINHEQGFNRLDGGVQILDLTHHLFVYRQTTGSIHQQDVGVGFFGRFNRAVGNGDWLLVNTGRVEQSADFTRQGFQLLDCRRTIHVGRNHHHLFLFTLGQILGQLTHGGGFTSTLQTGHHDNGWRLGSKVEFFVGFAHDRLQLFMDDFQEYLTRVQAFQNLGTNGALFYLIGKGFYHRQGNVGFQQCHAHFADGALDVVFCQLGLARNTFKGFAKAVGQTLEHNNTRYLVGCCGLRQERIGTLDTTANKNCAEYTPNRGRSPKRIGNKAAGKYQRRLRRRAATACEVM